MPLKTVKDLLAQKPFEPFRIIMSSGEQYEVRPPEMAWLTQTNVLVGVDETHHGVPAHFKICALLHVATIEPLGTGTTSSIVRHAATMHGHQPNSMIGVRSS